MKHIPFAAFPLQERVALMAALQRSGVALRHLCASRIEPAAEAEGFPAFAAVSAPGWSRAYAGGDWIARLEDDLGMLARR